MQLAYDHTVLEHFIPVAYEELAHDLIHHLKLDESDYMRMAHALRRYYHHHFYSELVRLKTLYRPFNPDSDLLSRQTYSAREYGALKGALVAAVTPLLEYANYEELTPEVLHAAMNKTSPYGVEVSVDFDDFEEILLFYRGEAHRYDEKRHWRSLYLKKERIRVDVYRRLFLLLKPKQLEDRAREIASREGRRIESVRASLRKNNVVLLEEERQERIYMKLFKDIPHADLEMLFPNTKVKMTLKDKLKIGITGGGGTIGALATLIGKLGTMMEPLSLLAAVGAFGGVLWRQIKTVFTHRTRYMAQLAKNLYFYNLDNNIGVVTHLVDMAESEESKEALLSYLFLSKSPQPLPRRALDEAIETYMMNTYNLPMNFEVDAGVRKLLELGLVHESEAGLRVEHPGEALKRLHELNAAS
ncbi:MAG: hypothetical protein DSZ03_05480 [Sulfurimonas sp.]|nr:MAG: hypothetical protein DSZ03_05480 [Sulfurimonas sp.]